MPESRLKLTRTAESAHDTLHVGNKRNRIKGQINVLRLIDKDTKQIILYIPSLDITTYGETDAKASDMLTTEIQRFFEYLIKLSPANLVSTLSELGFKQVKNKHKDFSKMVIDVEGNLQNFNIENGKVERFALVA